MITVENLQILNSLQFHEENEFALVKDEQKIYQYKNGSWNEYKSEQGLGVTLYEINKMAVAQLPDLDDDKIDAIKKDLKARLKSEYYMLLCRDANYYTVFIRDENLDVPRFEDEVIECLKALGRIRAIDFEDDDAVECWVMDVNDVAHVAYLFRYNEGVIKCR